MWSIQPPPTHIHTHYGPFWKISYSPTLGEAEFKPPTLEVWGNTAAYWASSWTMSIWNVSLTLPSPCIKINARPSEQSPSILALVDHWKNLLERSFFYASLGLILKNIPGCEIICNTSIVVSPGFENGLFITLWLTCSWAQGIVNGFQAHFSECCQV